MRPRAVLFDCDGVIVDSEPITVRLLLEDLAGYGLHMTAAALHARFIGGTIWTTAAQARSMGADLPENWERLFYDKLYLRLAEGTPLIDGIEAVLDRLDTAGITYAVGSNGEMQKMQITLGQHPDLWARLDGRVYSGQALGCPKPDPGLYLHAARAVAVDPAACVVVDDSPAGCLGGVSAGIRTLGFAATGNGADLAAIGAEPFEQMRDLPGMLHIPDPG